MKRVALSLGWRLVFAGLLCLLLFGCNDPALQADGDDADTCTDDKDCPDGLICGPNGLCIQNLDGDIVPDCLEDTDCSTGFHCFRGTCLPNEEDGDADSDPDSDPEDDADADGDVEEEGRPSIAVPETVDLPPLLTDESLRRPLTITSNGTAPLTIQNIAKQDGGSRDITVTDLPDFPYELAPGAVLSITIRYDQSNVGYDEARIQITSNARNTPDAVVLIRAVQTGKPNLRCGPSPLDFGKVDVQVSGGERRVIVCHNDIVSERDDNVLELSSLEIQSASSPAFTIPNDVPNALFIRSGGEVEIPVVFAPRQVSAHEATLQLFHNSESSESPLMIALSGEGGFKRLDLSPKIVSFGLVPVGSVATQTITLRGLGDFPVQVSAVEGDSLLPPEITLELDGLFDDGPLVLDPDDEATFDIVYTPTQPRESSGVLQVLSNGQDAASAVISISGTGANYVLRFGAETYDFGAVRPGEDAVLPLTLVNQGSQAAQVTGLTLDDAGGIFSLTSELNPPFFIASNQTLAFSMRFSPEQDIAYAGSIVLTVDSVETPTVTANLTGHGAFPVLRIDPDTRFHDFGEVNIGGAADVLFRLFNDGEVPLGVLDLAWLNTAQDPNSMITREYVGEWSIEPGGERLVRLTMSPPLNPAGSLPLTASRTLLIETDDPDNATVEINATGQAVSPLIQINPEGPVYDFGSYVPGYEATPIQVTLTNRGTGTLYIDDIHLVHTTHASFWLSGLPASFPVPLVGASSLTFTAHYRPTVYGNHTGTLRVVNRGYDLTNLTMPLQGAGANCPAGTHNCSGQCVVNSSVEHCGSNCVPCPEPAHSEALCVPWLSYYRCDFECTGNWKQAGDTCVPINTTACCGEFCENCSLRPATNGTWVCDPAQSACALSCDAYFHADGNNCLPNMTPDCCEGTCRACPAYPNADPTCTGLPGFTQCGIECWDDFGNCNNQMSDGCEIYTATSVNHCGGCRQPCQLPNAQPACVDGQCRVNGCSIFWDDCDELPGNGCEVSTNTSAEHCGECFNACSGANGTARCNSGFCVMQQCTSGYQDCNGDYQDGCEAHVLTNPNHCGMCNYQCILNHAITGCAQGLCTVEDCAPGWEDCDGLANNGCERNTGSDIYNCGDCDVLCLPTNAIGICGAGECHIQTCIGDFLDCNEDASDGCEARLSNDPNNCGACKVKCDYPGANSVCNAGHCSMGTCLSGYRNCNGTLDDGCERNIQTDNDHCGACFTTCRNPANVHGTTCAGGQCVIGTCDDGYGDCNTDMSNGCETNIFESTQHCGACGNPCSLANASSYCDMGVCKIQTCVSGWDSCDFKNETGCETRITTPENCGVCGNACDLPNTDAHLCVGGECRVSTCDANYGHCDVHHANGCETFLLDNNTHCGGCGVDCRTPPNATGVCSETICEIDTCLTGYGDCNEQFQDGCEFPLTTPSNTCTASTLMLRNDNITYIRGDQGNDISHVYEGAGEQWLRVWIKEEDDSVFGEALWALVELDVPSGVNYDVDVYADGCEAGNYLGTVNSGGIGVDEAFTVCASDTANHDDSFTVYMRIRFAAGSGCTPWKLTVFGHQDGVYQSCGSWWFKKSGDVVDPPPMPPLLEPIDDPSTLPRLRREDDGICEE